MEQKCKVLVLERPSRDLRLEMSAPGCCRLRHAVLIDLCGHQTAYPQEEAERHVQMPENEASAKANQPYLPQPCRYVEVC